MFWRLFLLILLLETAPSSLGSNGMQKLVVEEGYLKWVRKMGSFNHSALERAEYKQEVCLRITVGKDPRAADFVSIQQAINSVPDLNTCRVVISIGPGKYKEKIVVHSSKIYLTLEGAGAQNTVIQWAAKAQQKGENGKPMSTYNTSTVGVDAAYFIAKNITFKNTAPSPHKGSPGKQGVALRISGDAAMFTGCKFHGAQDTLYDHMGRHYFKDCYIEGTVDFIFGNGLSIYESCHIHGISNSHGVLTAQRRDNMLDHTGFSFINCKVTGLGVLYLGRAWGTFSRVVFAYTYMDKVITPKGWDDWGDKNRDMTVFYGQYRCSGPGANFGGRVPWSRELTAKEAEPFISLSFIDGSEWL